MNTNKIGKIINYIFAKNKDFSLEHRLLLSALIIGAFIGIFGCVANIFLTNSAVASILPFSLAFLAIVLYYFARFKNKYKRISIISAIIGIIGISIVWVLNGGINGPNFMFSLVFLMLGLIMVSNRTKSFLFVFFILVNIIIMLIQLYKPEIIVPYPNEFVRWIDILTSLIFSSVFIFAIIRFFHNNYTFERQRAEKSAAELRELVSTKDKLFSIIAHDLRSPFNNIIGLSELLIEKEAHDAKSEKYAGLINSSAKNTLGLLDNLLNWAISQTDQLSFNPKKIILSSLIREEINTSNSRALLKNISLKLIQNEEVEVYADENMVMVILRNLISNAIKFTNSGGEINVSVIPGTKQVEISILDNGIGMDEEKIKTLFHLSSNATSPGTANEKGSGLGLVLCKEFVEKLGGKIWVESEEGKGSDFKFTLPVNKLNE